MSNIPQQSNSAQAQLKHLGDEIKALREQQKPLSRRIGQAKKANAPADTLLEEMRALSSRIKQLTADRKHLLEMSTDSATASTQRVNKRAGENASADTNNGVLKPAYFQRESPDANPVASQTKTCAVETPSNAFSTEDFLPASVAICGDGASWDAYVQQHAAATAYHRFKFLDLIHDQHGLTVYPLAARDDAGSITAVLPIVHMKSALFGSFLVSLPYVNYGGVLANDDESGEQLMTASQALATHLGCSHSEIRETSEREAWYCRQHKASMTRALPATDELFDKEIGAKLRSQSRKAAAHGAEFRTGGQELLADFYTVFSTNMRDLGTPIYKAAFFARLLDILADDAFIAVVYIDGKPVATGFLIAHGETLEIPWASCLRRANRFDANMFLYRNILTTAIHRQYAFFDFGRSTIDGPTYRFKKQWGAVPQILYWHYWLSNPDDPPGLNPDNPKFRLVIAIWQKIPVAVTRIIGPLVAKHLP